MKPSSSLMLTHIKLALTAVFWGGTFIAGKIVSRDVAPFSAAFLRFLIANLFMIVLLKKANAGFHRLDRSTILLIAALGTTGIFLYNACFFQGLKTIDASRASLIIALNPVFIGIGAAIFYKDPWSPVKTVGTLLSLIGAVTVITRGNYAAVFSGGVGQGELFILCCVFSWVSFSLLGKKCLSLLSPLESVCYASIAGNILLLPPALNEHIVSASAGLSVNDWLALFYLGFFGTVLGFVWYYDGISRIGASKAGLYINLVPVSAVFMGWLFLNETIGIPILFGAFLVILGIGLTQQSAAIENALSSKKDRQAS
ncbi:MAG: DMT family transporter [Thermodesulfobacteriota bacterium]